MSTSAIKEGFICADCHAQFTNPNALLSHYQTQHSQEETKSIKGLLEKAKNKLTINNTSGGLGTNGSGSTGASATDESSPLIRGPPGYFDVYTVNIPDGIVYSHYEAFKKIRTIQVEKYSSDANKILIRLQKLLTLYCEDSGKRKAQEQEIVAWIDEKIVPRCPDCAQPFGILLRKHHCRLCGSILCENCSVFISREFGESIIKSQMGVTIVRDIPPPRSETVADRLTQQGLSVLNSSARNSFSLDPVIRDQNYHLRCCSFCYNLVAKKQFLASQSKAIITQFYDKLRALQNECEVKNVEYVRMISSLMEGESLYSIELATTFRNDIIKNTEKIDILSKKILVLGYDSGEENAISETEKRLRTRVRASTINWIRDFLSGLRLVPEKVAASGGGKPAATGVVKFVDGWTASKPDTTGIDESTDVMEIQIRNMRKWIDEARMAKKLDEVEILEANLSELLQIHYQQSL